MTTNIQIKNILDVPKGEAAKLPPTKLCLLIHESNAHLAHATKIKEHLESIIAFKYEKQFEAKRQRLEKKTGKVNIEDGDFKITNEVSKKITWDQGKLVQIVANIQKQGDDPSEYVEVTTTYKVPEKKYTAWPKSIRDVFEPARTEGDGKSTYKLIPQKKEEAA